MLVSKKNYAGKKFSDNAEKIGTGVQEPNRATGLKHVNWYY